MSDVSDISTAISSARAEFKVFKLYLRIRGKQHPVTVPVSNNHIYLLLSSVFMK